MICGFCKSRVVSGRKCFTGFWPRIHLLGCISRLVKTVFKFQHKIANSFFSSLPQNTGNFPYCKICKGGKEPTVNDSLVCISMWSLSLQVLLTLMTLTKNKRPFCLYSALFLISSFLWNNCYKQVCQLYPFFHHVNGEKTNFWVFTVVQLMFQLLGMTKLDYPVLV